MSTTCVINLGYEFVARKPNVLAFRMNLINLAINRRVEAIRAKTEIKNLYMTVNYPFFVTKLFWK